MSRITLQESIDHFHRWFNLGLDVGVINFVGKLLDLRDRGVAIVGSGASQSSAVLLARCIEYYLKGQAKPFTPYEYMSVAPV